MEKEQELFNDLDVFLDWKSEWKGMPEYNNVNQLNAEFTATFKFRNETDYKEFYELIKIHIFNGEKPFDGRQEKNSKTAWYPKKEKRSNFLYQDSE
jgi:hypothetical protein